MYWEHGFDEEIANNPHNLRHTFATWLAKSISDVSIVQKIFGHENVNTTLRYYVHTGDHELVSATANLRGRRPREQRSTPLPRPVLKVVPFPSQQAS